MNGIQTTTAINVDRNISSKWRKYFAEYSNFTIRIWQICELNSYILCTWLILRRIFLSNAREWLFLPFRIIRVYFCIESMHSYYLFYFQTNFEKFSGQGCISWWMKKLWDFVLEEISVQIWAFVWTKYRGGKISGRQNVTKLSSSWANFPSRAMLRAWW